MSETRINDRIRAKYVLLVLEDGTKYGRISTQEALSMASEKDLDLMQVANNDIPICKFVDYGKMKYEQSKQAKHSKHKNKHHNLKGMRISFFIAQHDLDTKSNKIRDFLGKKMDVRVIYSGKLGRRLILNPNEVKRKEKFDELEYQLVNILNGFSDMAKWEKISRSQTTDKLTFSVILKHIPKK